MLAGVAEMVARTAVAIVLVPVLGYFGAELSNPAAWIAACLFLYPAYRWTCRQLDNRLLAARLHIQATTRRLCYKSCDRFHGKAVIFVCVSAGAPSICARIVCGSGTACGRIWNPPLPF